LDAKDASGNKILVLDTMKWLEIHPFLKDANFRKMHIIAGHPKAKLRPKKDRSKKRQAQIFEYLLESGKCSSKAEIAKRFGVSRAWVSKVI